MNQGFSIFAFPVATSDGRNVVMLDSVNYVDARGVEYVIPEGLVSDGASIPHSLWSLLPPFGAYWRAAVLHDAAYKNKLTWHDGNPCGLTREQCDDLLKDAMGCCGVPSATMEAIYNSVRMFGQLAFDEDRKV